MAEETPKIEPPTTVPVAPPAWDVNLQNTVQALLKSQQPAAPAATTEASNPYIAGAPAAASPEDILRRMAGQGSLPAGAAQAHNLAAAAAKGLPPEAADIDLKLLGQLPVQTLLQMGQHQVNPQVEAAKERIIKALAQNHSIGVVPQAPVAKA